MSMYIMIKAIFKEDIELCNQFIKMNEHLPYSETVSFHEAQRKHTLEVKQQ